MSTSSCFKSFLSASEPHSDALDAVPLLRTCMHDSGAVFPAKSIEAAKTGCRIARTSLKSRL